MQTLERTREPHSESGGPTRPSSARMIGLVVAAALLVAAVGVAYGVGRAQRSTKTVVRTVTATAPAPSTPVIDDRGYSKLDNGHQAETNVFEQPLDVATQARLQHQLILARQAAMRYPTVADAEAAGWHRAGPFAPGLGVHFFKWGGSGGSSFVPEGPMTDANVLAPASLIYDGTGPNSRIAGLMYLGAGFRIPQGFAGTNDIWHFHTNVCTVFRADGGIDTPFGADTTVPKAMCDGVGGNLARMTPYMLHAWVVPGYDSPQGVFSHDNAAITCRDGSYHTISITHIGTRKSICVDGGE